MQPYRESDNELLVIDTRLSTLEKKVEVITAWRRFAFFLGVALVATSGFAIFAGDRLRRSVPDDGCVDEVKQSRVLSFQHPQGTDVIEGAMVRCSHPRQRGQRPYTYENGSMTLECYCR